MEGSESYIKNTKLDYASLYPTNCEKQKVHLACNIFNEKTSAELRRRGKIDTAVFVEAVTKLWNTQHKATEPRQAFERSKPEEI